MPKPLSETEKTQLKRIIRKCEQCEGQARAAGRDECYAAAGWRSTILSIASLHEMMLNDAKAARQLGMPLSYFPSAAAPLTGLRNIIKEFTAAFNFVE